MPFQQADLTRLNTVALVAQFTDRLKPKSLFRSLFTETNSNSKYISLQIQRVIEGIAVDVVRGSSGNRNNFAKSTEKLYDPAYYDEWFDATELDLYDQLFYGPDQIPEVAWGKFIQEVATKLDILMDKIDRAYEKQCSDALHFGYVLLADGTKIQYNRQAQSIVDLTSTTGYWDNTAVDPNDSLTTACQFLRNAGKMEGAVVDAIMGSTAWAKFKNNTAVQNRNKGFQYGFDKLGMGIKNSVGSVPQGTIDVDNYMIRVWTYPDIYEDASGNQIPYMDPKKVILVPEAPKFNLSYAASPQLLMPGQPAQKEKFLVYDYKDFENAKHKFGVKSTGAAVLTAVDQAYTMKVLA
jgi:hypothetical protein